MRHALVLLTALTLLHTGCGGIERPAPEVSQNAVATSLSKYGTIVDYSAGPGRKATKDPFPDVYWAVPFRAAIKLRDDVYWENPGSMTYSIGNYQIPGKLMHLSEFAPSFQRDLVAGKAHDFGGRTFRKLAAGSLYVCDGKVIFKVDDEYVHKLDEVQHIRRGTCSSTTPCYTEVGIADPAAEPAR